MEKKSRNNEKWKSRTAWIAVSIIVIATTYLPLGFINGGEWVAAVGFAAGLFGTNQYLNKRKG